jgi:taspase (threonine aspartase 1)
MQRSVGQNQNLQKPINFRAAFTRLRQLSQEISKSSHKALKYNTEFAPSPIEENTDKGPKEFGSLSTTHPLPTANKYIDPKGLDGAPDKMFRKSAQSPRERPSNVSAIFVHAGAGYHSTTNEHIHLGACDR